MEETLPRILLQESLVAHLGAVDEGENRLLSVDIRLLCTDGLVRPYIRWLDFAIPSPRQHARPPSLPVVLVRPGFSLHLPADVLHQPIVLIVERLGGVQLRSRMMLALCFYQVLHEGHARLRLAVETSVLGSSHFAYGEGTALEDVCGPVHNTMHGCGEYTMMSDDEAWEEQSDEAGDDADGDNDE